MSKTFAIADLHGRFDLMGKALARIEESYHSGGKVVFLGDYVDRGPASKQVIDRLIAGPPQGWDWVTLKGNHEDMMVACHSGPDRGWWLNNGGDATLESYGGTVPAEHLEWAQRLPMIHADKHRVFVHAAIDPTKPLDGQSETMLLWTRYPEKADITYPGLHIVHGHTPHRGGPELYAGRTNLDTGAVFTGRLVVAVFDDDRAGGPVSFIEVTA